jgi:hypothetical protein
MLITSPIAGSGIDWSVFNNYSMYTYAPGTTYIGVSNTTVPLSTGSLPGNIGYFAFVRGDRSRTPDNTIFSKCEYYHTQQ